MIPRYQKILFAVLILASIGMGFFLWQLHRHAHQRMLQGEDHAPTQAPQVAPSELATLLVAYDADGTLLPQGHSMPLPKDTGARARALIARLLDLYAGPDAVHPVAGGGNAVLGVFLIPVADASAGMNGGGPNPSSPEADRTPRPAHSSTGSTLASDTGVEIKDNNPSEPQLAVINLSGSFANSHPAGIQPEMLTILSICGTLHANLPQIAQVRFLVDGQTRATLAGHADLTRTYLTGDPATGARQ